MYLPRKLHVLLLVVTTLLTAGAAVFAQQDADVTVTIKAKSRTAVLPTLLVLCDLACNLNLDGEAKWHIDAGGSAKIKVEPGQHMVAATTEDGFDQVKQPSTVKPTGQTMVSIELWPIRYARLVAEQEALDAQRAAEQSEKARIAAEAQAMTETKAELEYLARKGAYEKADREKAKQAKQEERDRVAREEAAGLTWTDTETGLMWTKKGKDHLNWKQATAYCQNLQLAGYSDWSLPGYGVLESIYDSHAGIGIRNVKGKLQLPRWIAWSSSQGDSYKKVYLYDFKNGLQFQSTLGGSESALCVRSVSQ